MGTTKHIFMILSIAILCNNGYSQIITTRIDKSEIESRNTC